MRTFLRYLAATVEWAGGLTMFVSIFATFDGRSGVALAFLGLGLVAVLTARFLEGFIDAP